LDKELSSVPNRPDKVEAQVEGKHKFKILGVYKGRDWKDHLCTVKTDDSGELAEVEPGEDLPKYGIPIGKIKGLALKSAQKVKSKPKGSYIDDIVQGADGQITEVKYSSWGVKFEDIVPSLINSLRNKLYEHNIYPYLRLDGIIEKGSKLKFIPHVVKVDLLIEAIYSEFKNEGLNLEKAKALIESIFTVKNGKK
jgi:hypothetical protein